MATRLTRSIIAPRITTGDRKTPEGILPFDFDNKYPVRCLDVVNASGVASTCVKLYAKFIEGKGFADDAFYKAIINDEGLTNDKLLRDLAKDYAKHGGFAIHVNYNALYKITEVNHVPFLDCRLIHPDSTENQGTIAVYNDWARRLRSNIKRDEIQYIDKFTIDPIKIEQQVIAAGGWENYKGQLFWYSTSGKNYPLAPYDSVIEDMETDGRIKSHRRKKAATAFNSDFFFEVMKFESEQERQDCLAMLEDNQGDNGSGNVILHEIESKDQSATLIPIPKADANSDYYKVNEEAVQDNIRKNFGFTPMLIGGVVTGMGISQATVESCAFVNGMTNRERREMEETFKVIFDNFHAEVNPSKNYSIIPFSIEFSQTTIPATV